MFKGLIVVALAFASSALAQPAPAQPDAGKRGAAAAIGAFAFGCLERLRFSATAEAYAAGTDKLAAQVKSQGAALPFTIESANGDSCRVVYQGPQVDFLWATLSDFGKNRKNAPCTGGPATPGHASIACTGTKMSPAYEERLERDGDRFTASVTWKGPGLP